MSFKTRTTKLTDNDGEHAGLTQINPQYVIETEDSRALMHDLRVLQIETELAPTRTTKSFMDAVRLFNDEYDIIRHKAEQVGFTKEESPEVAYAVQQIRRERALQEDDINPRLNALAGDAQVYGIAQELNRADSEDAVERLISRFRELHVHENDHKALVPAVKRRVAISDQYQTGLRIVG